MKKILIGLGILSCISSLHGQDELYFSTEEDFVSTSPDGITRVISDGDLLTLSGSVYMTNADLLLSTFDEPNDLGLDAVDVILSEKKLVAFSTELDSTFGVFDAGDLLFTSGAVIHNEALLFKFGLPKGLNLGLDAVKLIGDKDLILQFINFIQTQPIDYFATKPAALADLLTEFQVDIWFSTEGTSPLLRESGFLDGDILSARDGIIVAGQDILMEPAVPGGIPFRGVDYGLDALMTPRQGVRDYIFFSTEILNYEPFFTDGDLLTISTPGVLVPNPSFIYYFFPRTSFLGLDAVSYFE